MAKSKVTIKRIWVCFFLGLTATIALTESHSNPFFKDIAGPDSSVFLSMAWFKREGLLWYRDVFDHKGPVIYLINVLFAHGKNYWTIWFYELFSLILVGVYAYKNIRLFFNNVISITSTAYIILLTGILIRGGNWVEEYALPFVLIALYIFMQYLMNKRQINYKNAMCLGITCAVVLLLRPNMVACWVVFGIGTFIRELSRKRFTSAYVLAGGFIIGSFIVIVPFVIYFLVTGTLNDFINCYWTYNFAYSNTSIASVIGCLWRNFIKIQEFNLITTTVSLMLILCIYIITNKEDKRLQSVLFLFYIIIQVLLVDMSGRGYEHYYVLLIPIFLYGFANLLNLIIISIQKVYLINLNKKKKCDILLALVVGVSISGILIPKTGLVVMKRALELKENNPMVIQLQATADYIQTNSNDDDTILCLGVGMGYSSIYHAAKRLPASNYFFTPPSRGELRGKLFDEIQKDIKENKPKFIIKKEDSDYLNPISLAGYELVKNFGYNQIYEIKREVN